MRYTVVITIIVALSSAHGAVRLPSIIGSNMVIQRDKPIVIWGWADPDEKVSVTFAGGTKETVAKQDGSWKVELEPISKGEGLTMTIEGKNTISLYNIIVGDVWLAAGQSNMEWPLKNSKDARSVTRDLRRAKIRIFSVKVTPNPKPQDNCEGEWVVANSRTAAMFSAVAISFGIKIYRNLRIPLGLIGCYKGGTPAKAWTSVEVNQSTVDGKKLLLDWEYLRLIYKPAVEKQKHEKALAEWRSKPKHQRSKWPPQEFNPFTDITQPSGLYNGLIHPLVPYPLKGFIWYQGEHDSNSAKDAFGYRDDLTNLITDWRKRWGDDKLPFLFVQLPNYKTPYARWDITRDSMLHVYKTVPKTGMAVIIDVGAPNSPHPRDKKTVGNRLGYIALHDVYDKLNIDHMGPLYRSMQVKDDKIHLSFKFLGGGLIASDGKPLRHFTIAGKDRKFVPANAVIDGIEVIVSAKSVSKPVAVRYAWSNNPEGINFYNRAELPASPFRTDDWALDK